jgi:hypothetical protein
LQIINANADWLTDCWGENRLVVGGDFQLLQMTIIKKRKKN